MMMVPWYYFTVYAAITLITHTHSLKNWLCQYNQFTANSIGSWSYTTDCTLSQTTCDQGSVTWLASNTTWTDYTVECTINVASQYGCSDSWAGIIFRAQSIGDDTNSGQYYAVYLHMEHSLSFSIFNNAFEELKTDSSINIAFSTDYLVKIQVAVDQFTVSMDNKSVFSATNSQYSFGSVGLRTFMARATFTNLHITGFPTLSPTTTAPTTAQPSSIPTESPSTHPTYFPSHSPSQTPTNIPTIIPTLNPTNMPTFEPSLAPTVYPSYFPSLAPAISPSLANTKKTIMIILIVIISCFGFFIIVFFYQKRYSRIKRGKRLFAEQSNLYIPLIDMNDYEHEKEGSVDISLISVARTKGAETKGSETNGTTRGESMTCDVNEDTTDNDEDEDEDAIYKYSAPTIGYDEGSRLQSISATSTAGNFEQILNDNVVGVDLVMDDIIHDMDTDK